jgi:hypothetical protein
MATPSAPQSAADDPDLFGEAAEDGLRILAALEAMESLEPDFCDGLVGDASVTIIESAAPGALPLSDAENTRGSARQRPHVDATRHASYRGPIEEAIVEIFEAPGYAPAAPSSGPRRKKRRPVGERFFKALTDGGKD